MGLSAKPTAYTVNTGHAKCPNHLFMLDEGSGSSSADAVGSLDLTITDPTPMWQTDGTYGQVLRCASGDYALSATGLSASSSVCVVAICKSASATNPGAAETVVSVAKSSVNSEHCGLRFNTSGQATAIYDSNAAAQITDSLPTDYYDGSWHMLAAKIYQDSGNVSITESADGGNWSGVTSVADTFQSDFNRIGVGVLAQNGPANPFAGDVLAVFVYKDDAASWDNAWIASLWANPWQFLTTTVKKLKLLAHPSAASAANVAGVVFLAPGVGDITGARIGEFTGKTFEASTEGAGDAERAVLKVPVADFGGGSLTTSDTPVALVRNATYATEIVPCAVIEE